MKENSRLPSINFIYYWVGNVIMSCSILAVVVLLVMKFVAEETIYVSDILILTGFALIGYVMRRANQKKIPQEDNKNE